MFKDETLRLGKRLFSLTAAIQHRTECLRRVRQEKEKIFRLEGEM